MRAFRILTGGRIFCIFCLMQKSEPRSALLAFLGPRLPDACGQAGGMRTRRLLGSGGVVLRCLDPGSPASITPSSSKTLCGAGQPCERAQRCGSSWACERSFGARPGAPGFDLYYCRFKKNVIALSQFLCFLRAV